MVTKKKLPIIKRMVEKYHHYSLVAHNNMVASDTTTLATPHNGSQAADKFGNTEAVRKIMFALNRFMGKEYSILIKGLCNWALNNYECSYIDYIKRVSKSKIWTLDDNAADDLTLDGSAKLNNMTSMNPNITYTTYTGVSSLYLSIRLCNSI